MTKRELIELLESTDMSDDAEVSIEVYYNADGDSSSGVKNEVEAEDGEIVLSCRI